MGIYTNQHLRVPECQPAVRTVIQEHRKSADEWADTDLQLQVDQSIYIVYVCVSSRLHLTFPSIQNHYFGLLFASDVISVSVHIPIRSAYQPCTPDCR